MTAQANSAILPQAISTTAALNVVLSTAMTNTKSFDGTEAVGTAMALLFTSDADGSTAPILTLNYTSTNGATPSGTSNATVLHLFLNNGVTANTTASANSYIGSITIPAQPYTSMNTAEMPTWQKDLHEMLPRGVPGGYRIYGGLTTAMGGTNCGLGVLANAADY